MVEIPGASALGGIPSGRSGRGIARRETGAVASGAAALGAGIVNLGQSSMRLAEAVAAKTQEVEDYQVQARFLDWQQRTATRVDEEMRGVSPDALSGYAADFLNPAGAFYGEGMEFMASVPERLREEYNVRLMGFRNQLHDSTNSYALQQLNSISLTTARDAVDAVLGQIPQAAASPDPMGAAALLTDQARSVIAGAPHLTQAQQAAELSTVTRNINTALISELIRTGQYDLVDQLVGADPIATSARVLEAAGGVGTISDSQWVTVAGDVLRAGMSVDEIEAFDADPTTARSSILAARNNPDVVAEVAARVQEANAQALATAGVEATPGNLMLAQAVGPNAAIVISRVAGTNPDVRVADVVPASVVVASPELAALTVGEAAAWADGRVASTAAYGHRMASGLTLDDRAAFIADNNRARNASATAAAASAEAQRANLLNNLLVNIHDGNAGMTEINAARQAGWLTDFDDIKKAEQAYEDRNGEISEAAEGLRLLSDANYQFSPFNSEDRDRVDAAYQAMGGPTAITAPNAAPEEQAQAVTVLRAVVDRAGIIPQSALEALQGGMFSSNRQTRDAAFSMLDIIYADNPDVLRRTLSSDQFGRLQDWQALGQFLSPEEMDARFAPTLNPQEEQRRETLREQGRALAVEVPVEEIVNTFIRGFWGAGPETLPLDPADTIELQSDFATLFAERYAVSTNADLARRQALEALGQKWGVTDVGNTRRVMAYPPEQQYPAINGSHEWINRDLETLIEEQFPTEPVPEGPGQAARERTQPPTVFGLDIMPGSGANGLPARYRVLVMDADGVMHVLSGDNNTGYQFDFDKYLDEARTNFGTTRATSAMDARFGAAFGVQPAPALVPTPGAGFEPGRGAMDYGAFADRQNTEALSLERATPQRQTIIDRNNGLTLQ